MGVSYERGTPVGVRVPNLVLLEDERGADIARLSRVPANIDFSGTAVDQAHNLYSAKEPDSPNG